MRLSFRFRSSYTSPKQHLFPRLSTVTGFAERADEEWIRCRAADPRDAACYVVLEIVLAACF